LVRFRPFDPYPRDISSSTDIGYKHQLKVVLSIDGKSDASTSVAAHPDDTPELIKHENT
jgi:hypothetical protein